MRDRAAEHTQGAAYAAALLQGVGHEVVVVGESDRKADGRWPCDPHPFAWELHGRPGRAVKAALPRATAKDVRAWRAIATDEAVRGPLLTLAASARPVDEAPAACPAASGSRSRPASSIDDNIRYHVNKYVHMIHDCGFEDGCGDDHGDGQGAALMIIAEPLLRGRRKQVQARVGTLLVHADTFDPPP